MSYSTLRQLAGKTQKQAAEEIGVTPACVAMWETGKTSPSAGKLKRVAEVYGCTIEDLLKAKEERAS